jgi:hypothetical protein
VPTALRGNGKMEERSARGAPATAHEEADVVASLQC